MPKSAAADTLRVIARALEELNADELDALALGKGRLAFVPFAPVEARPVVQEYDVTPVILRLEKCSGRDEALAVLEDVHGRDQFVAIAKALKVHVVKGDRVEGIQNKIVSFVVGGKLRTEAIQSLNLRGGGAGVMIGNPQEPVSTE